MKGPFLFLILFLTAAILLPVAAFGLPLVYHLTAESTYEEGCVGSLCFCPVLMANEISGDFSMRYTGASSDGFDVYTVDDVLWTVTPSWTGETVTGSGTYRRSEEFQRLTLQLRVGELTYSVNSGVVPIPTEFPDIDVTVYTGHTECYGIRVRVAGHAEDAVPNDLTTWGRLKALSW